MHISSAAHGQETGDGCVVEDDVNRDFTLEAGVQHVPEDIHVCERIHHHSNHLDTHIETQTHTQAHSISGKLQLLLLLLVFRAHVMSWWMDFQQYN